MQDEEDASPTENLEPIDEWLEGEGLYRKRNVRDGSCLFRAAAEQIFNSQSCHLQVREEVVQFMKQNKFEYQQLVDGSFEDHMKQIEDPLGYGGIPEIKAISKLYKRKVCVYYKEGSPPAMTGFNFTEKLDLCYSNGDQYDTVYTKSYTENLGFYQALVFNALYTDVFKLTEVMTAGNEMYKNDSPKQIRKNNPVKLGKLVSSADKPFWANDSLIPFHLTAAKTLDKNSYRNTEFRGWNTLRKEVRLGMLGLVSEFRVGVKCLVNLEPSETPYSAFILNVCKGKRPMRVFIEALHETRLVDINQLQLASKTDKKFTRLTLQQSGDDIWDDAMWKMKRDCKREPVIITEYFEDEQPAIEFVQQQQGAKDPQRSGEEFDSTNAAGNVTQQDEANTFPATSVSLFGTFSSANAAGNVTQQEEANTFPATSVSLFGESATRSEDTTPSTNSNPQGWPNEEIDIDGINVFATKSNMPDFSDLPLEDLPTLQFFFNLGVEVYNSSSDLRENVENNSPEIPDTNEAGTSSANATGPYPSNMGENADEHESTTENTQYSAPVHTCQCFNYQAMVPQFATPLYPVMSTMPYQVLQPSAVAYPVVHAPMYLVQSYPMESTYYQQPISDHYEEQPTSDPYEEQPTSDPYEEQPTSDHYEEEPSSDHYEETEQPPQ